MSFVYRDNLTTTQKAEFDAAVQTNDAAARSLVYSYLEQWNEDLTIFLVGGSKLYGPLPDATATVELEIGAARPLRVTVSPDIQAFTIVNIDGVTPRPTGPNAETNNHIGSAPGQDVRLMLKSASVTARYSMLTPEELYSWSGVNYKTKSWRATVESYRMLGASAAPLGSVERQLYPQVSLFNPNMDKPHGIYLPDIFIPMSGRGSRLGTVFQSGGVFDVQNIVGEESGMVIDAYILEESQAYPAENLAPVVDWALSPSDEHQDLYTDSPWPASTTEKSGLGSSLDMSNAGVADTYSRTYGTFNLLDMGWVGSTTPTDPTDPTDPNAPDPTNPDPNAPDPNSEPPTPVPMPDRNPPNPNAPDPNAPDPNAPDPNAPDPNAPDPNAPVPGEQPPTVRPMPRPITSSCKSTMDGPASCNFVVDPLPGSNFPKPGDVVATPGFATPDFATPDFETPDFAPMPVIDVNFPEMPPIGCNLPDFTNMSDCPPVPGTGGPLPGGRDRRGKRGINPNIKTGGKTHGKRRKVFPGPKHSGPHKRCFPAGASCMFAITELLIGVGISPLDIVFQIGPEWDKQLRREKCFKRGVSRLDAAAWFASKLMCRIIDEGPPTHNVYIGPPHHRPGQKTWTFDEHFDLFAVSHSSTSEGSYHAVEVFGDHFREPYPISLVENPFASPDESEILQIEVGPDYTRREAEQLAAFRAAALRRASVSVQASVPYSEEYMMRDRMILRAPDRGFQETYLIYGKQSDLSPEGRIHILTGVLPATAREMEQFPKVK